MALGGATVPTTTAAAVTPTTIDTTVVSGTVTGGTTTGQSYSLTTSTDTKTLSAGNDTVDGSTVVNSLNTGDIIVDGYSTDADVLNATFTTAITPSITNVETVNLTDTYGGNVFTASGISGGKIVLGSTSGFNGVISSVDGAKITSVQGGDTITSLDVRDISNNAVIVQNKATTITLDGLTEDADATTINLSGTALSIAAGANDIKTLNLKSSGTASTVTLTTTVIADSAASIAVSGDATVTLKASAADIEYNSTTPALNAGISKAMTGTAKFNTNVTTLGGAANYNLTKVAADAFEISSSTALGDFTTTFAAGTTNLTLSKNVITSTTTTSAKGFVAYGSAATDTLNLTETVANTNLMTSGYETVNLTNSTGAALSKGKVDVGTSGTINLTSAYDVTLAASTFKKVDASGLTGTAKLSVTGAAMTTDAAVTGNANATTVDLSAASGANTIITLAGNDTLSGGSANDTIDSGAGNDAISTGTGTNLVLAGDGDDAITLSTGSDNISTGSGSNSVSVATTAWSTADTLQGGSGSDTLNLTGVGGGSITMTSSAFTGFEKIDVTGIQGTALTVTLVDANVSSGTAFTFNATQQNTAAVSFYAGGDTDATFTISVKDDNTGNTLTGGALADTITFTASNAAATTTVTGGKGADSITLALGTGITARTGASSIVLAKGASDAITAVTSGMSVSGFDVVTGLTSALDTITLGNASATFDSGIKTSSVALADNKAYQFQGSYSSTTKTFTLSSSGTDSMIVYDADSTTSTQFEGLVMVGMSADTTASSINTTTGLFTLSSSVTGTAAADTLTGTAAADTINGLALGDMITGAGGIDILDGGTEDDTFVYLLQADLFTGGNIVDTITGGAGTGDAILIGTNATAFTIATGDSWARANTVEKITSVANTAVVSITLNDDVTTAGITTVDLSGDTSATGSNVIDISADTAGSLITTITGSAGVDTITGNSIAQTITGGEGADIITGGAGDDSIVLTETTPAADTVKITLATDGTDTITGFAADTGADVLSFATAGFVNGTPAATLKTLADVAAFTAGLAAIGANDIFVEITASQAAAGVDTAAEVGTLLSTAATAMTNITTGDKIIVALDDGTDMYLWYWVDSATNAGKVDTAELTLAAKLVGVTDIADADLAIF